MQIKSNNKEKFEYACKSMHELAANVFESFKQVDYHNKNLISHHFKIIMYDFNQDNMDFID